MVSRVAVLSDIHGVLPALTRVLAEPLVRQADLIVVAGDYTWGPQPAQVLDVLAGLGQRARLLRGNADRELVAMARGHDVGLGDDPVSVWGAEQLAGHHLLLIEAMPTSLTIDVDGLGKVHFCHATPRNDHEVVLVDSRPERWLEVFADLPADVETVVCGHTHMPYVRLADRRLVVNPGSVGLPYGRGGPHWAYLADGHVTLGRTAIDPVQLAREVVRDSSMPGVDQWAAENIARPAGDFEALAVFGPRDGRSAGVE